MRKIIGIFLCLTFAFFCFACADQAPSEEAVSSTSGGNGAEANQPLTVPNTLPTEQEKNEDSIDSRYDVILGNIIKAYPWNDDERDMVYEHPELSYMYRRNESLSEVGFALIDLDSNGCDELVIGDIEKQFVYDVYTVINGEAVHLFDSGERYYYSLYENGFVELTWSSSAATSGHDFYRITDGALVFIERITVDAYHARDIGLIKDIAEADENNTFFRSSTDRFEDYKLVPFDEALQAIDTYQNANKVLEIQFVPLSEHNHQNDELSS